MNDRMSVYLRVRPLLKNLEDKKVWFVDSDHNTIENNLLVSEIMNSNLKKRYLD